MSSFPVTLRTSTLTSDERRESLNRRMRFAEERRMRLIPIFIVVGSAIWVGVDASKRDWRNDRFATKTAYWVLGTLLLWILIFPTYFIHREHVPLKNAASREQRSPQSIDVASVVTEEPRTLTASPLVAPNSIEVYRECPHCAKAMPRDASTCPHCLEESRAWVNSDGVWWVENEGGWFWLNELSGTWIESEGV